MKAIHTDKAPAAIGPYSQAIEVNGFVFASGQIPIDPATGVFVEGGIQEQTRQALITQQLCQLPRVPPLASFPVRLLDGIERRQHLLWGEKGRVVMIVFHSDYLFLYAEFAFLC